MVSPIKVAAFACLLVCFSITTIAQLQKSVADKIVAVVGDEIILRSDVQNWLEDLRRQGNPVLDSTQCAVVKNIVESKILLLQALKDSIAISDEEVETEMSQRISNPDLPQDKRKQIFTYIKEYRLANLMQEKILSKVKITPTEVKSFYQSIPANQFPFLETQYEVGQIIVYPKATAEMENYLLAEMNRYKQRVESKQISFQKLAISVSEDKSVKEREGYYQLNRNMKDFDQSLLSAAFRLKAGEISIPLKIKGGYYCLVKMIELDGDDATVSIIFRAIPIAEKEIKDAIFNLNTVRAEIKLGETSFEQAAKKNSENKQASFSSFIQNRNGESFVTLDELPTDLAKEVSNLKTGDISEAKQFIDEVGKQAIRIIFLKSKIEAHRMNITDDYSRVAQLALDNKKQGVLVSWFKTKIPDFHITIEEDILVKCGELRKYNN